MGEKNYLGSILVGYFAVDYFVGAFFESLVVGVLAIYASGAIEGDIFVVD